MLRHKHFDHMSNRSWDIDRNTFLYGCHLENPIYPLFPAFLNGTIVFFDSENMIRHQDFYHMPPTSWDIDKNMFLYGIHLENPIWPAFAAFLNGTAEFLASENIWFDTRILIVCHLEAKIWIKICFSIAAILKIQYCRRLLLF